MLWWNFRELKADDWRKREGAARKLGELKDPRVIDPLIATLKDKNPHVRSAAVDSLVQIGDPAVRSLVAALKSKHPEAREGAENALVKIGNPSVTPLGLALYDRDLGVREAAATALGRIGDAAAMEQLVSAVKYGDFGVKEAAAAGLVRLGSLSVNSLVAALKDNKARVRETAAAALVRIGPAAIEPLVAALKDSDVREAATEALWKIDPNWAKSDAARAVVPTFVSTLRNGDERSRRAAATVLGEVGNAAAFDALLAALADQNEGVQEAAATALGDLGDGRAFLPLVEALRRNGTKARHAAAAALVQLGNTLVEPLVEALKDPSAGVREAAAAVCVRIGHSAVEPLAETLWQIDPDWSQTEEMKGGVPRFVATLKEGGAKVMRESVEMAKRLGNQRAVKPLVATMNTKVPAVTKASHPSGEPTEAYDLKALVEALEAPDSPTRASALTALLRVGNTAEEPLLAALRTKNPTLRRAAAHALAAAGDGRSRDTLRCDLKDASPIIKLDAAESLVNLRDASVGKPLIKLLTGFYDAPPENDPSQLHCAKRVFRLVRTLLERDAEEMLVEDLHALVHFKIKRAPRFVSSAESSASPEAAELDEQSRNILPGTDGEVDFARLKDLARRELNRRSHKAAS